MPNQRQKSTKRPNLIILKCHYTPIKNTRIIFSSNFGKILQTEGVDGQ